MRLCYLISFAFILASTLAFAELPQADTKEFEPLANQLIDALQREDIVAFSQCWISIQQAEQGISNLMDDEVKKSQQARLKLAFEKRNLNIVHSYRILIDEFRKQGMLTELKFHHLEMPRVNERHGVRSTTSIKIFVTVGAIESSIWIDTCTEYQKLWFLCGNPLALSLGPMKNQVPLELPEQKKVGN